MRCPKCNYNNLDGSAVCNLCGELLYSYGPNYNRPARTPKRAGQVDDVAQPAPTKPAAPKPDPRTQVYQLVCFPLDPVRLLPDTVYSIGRASKNDIILPVGQVSREHARIEWRGDAFVLVDLNSHNGTFVNGKRLKEHDLTHGDQIKVGPYLLEIYVGPAAEPAPADKALEATQDMAALDSDFSIGPFSGRLAEIELREIVHLMNVTRKSGKLEVKTPACTGEVHFLEGDIVDAKWGFEEPIKALAVMLHNREGSFRFLRGDTDIHRTLHGPTSKILIEAIKLGSRM